MRLPVVIEVTDGGVVTYEVDTTEAGTATTEIDLRHPDPAQVYTGSQAIQADHTRGQSLHG